VWRLSRRTFCIYVIHSLLIFTILCNLLEKNNLYSKPPSTEPILIMGRRPRFTSEQRSTAIGMLHGGMQYKAVAEHFGVAASTISRLKVVLWNLTGSGPSNVRGNEKTSAADDRYVTRIIVTSRRNREMSAPKLTKTFHATSGIRVSTQTIWNRL